MKKTLLLPKKSRNWKHRKHIAFVFRIFAESLASELNFLINTRGNERDYTRLDGFL